MAYAGEGVDLSKPDKVDSSAILEKGKTFCGRYINEFYSSKIMTLNEAISRSRAGLELFSIYEVTTDEFEGGTSAGHRAGHAAFVGAQQVHQPAGTPIYFSADLDIDKELPGGPEQIAELQKYLEACAMEVGPYYTVGIYASSDALDGMAASGAAQYFWQSDSKGFSGHRNGTQNPHDHLWQYIPLPKTVPIPNTDYNHAVQPWFGQWKAPLIPLHLYNVWRGAGSDEAIWWDTYNGTSWTGQQRVPGITSSDGPALALYNGILHMAWRGGNNDPDLWHTTFDGSKWAAQQRVPATSGAKPALAVFRNRLYLAWRGPGMDESLYYISFDGKSWDSETQIHDVGSAAAPALSVFENRLAMTWRGAGHDESLYYSTFDGKSWAKQEKIPHEGSAASPALALFDGKLYMAWRGAGHDTNLWFSGYNGKSWSKQEKFPGVASADGPALSVFDGKLRASYRSDASDESLYYISFDGKSWDFAEKILNIGSAAAPALLAP